MLFRSLSRHHKQVRPSGRGSAGRIGKTHAASILQNVGAIGKRIEMDVHVAVVDLDVMNTVVSAQAVGDTRKHHARAQQHSLQTGAP